MVTTAEKQRLFSLDVIQTYREVMIENLQSSFTGLNHDEITNAVDWAISNNFTNHPAKLDNNYTKQAINGTVLDILSYIQRLEPILTASGVLYKKHKEADNPLSKMVMGFIKQRKIYKKQMFKYPRGSYEFEKYNLLQLLEKLNANATYGIIINVCRLIVVIWS